MRFPRLNRNDSSNPRQYILPAGTLQPHYYQLLNMLLRVEVSLKIFFHLVLAMNMGATWADTTNVDTEEGSARTVSKIAKQRQAQAQIFEYISRSFAVPILALTLGELCRGMCDTYWKLFARHFPASQEVTKHRLGELVALRNSLFHFRAVSVTDVVRVEMLCADLFGRIDAFLLSVFETSHETPRNSRDGWYVALRERALDRTKVCCFEDGHRNWVTLGFEYQGTELERRATRQNSDPHLRVPDDAAIVLTRLRSNLLLQEEFEVLRRWTVVVREGWPTYCPSQQPIKVPIRKWVYLTLPRSAIVEQYEAIGTELLKLMHRIETESSMVRDHANTAGVLVERCSVETCWQNDDGTEWYECGDQSEFLCFRGATDVPAYWGFLSSPEGSFIADCRQFPWISNPWL
ncbi:MAG: hypothetical protein LC687_04220 [Actinobacteria bacterium]|nr:hypothetical protein [Actinomycetota bacterium]